MNSYSGRSEEPFERHLDKVHDRAAEITDMNIGQIEDDGDDLPAMSDGARAAVRAEKEMTLRQALKSCRMAVFWSLVFTSAIIMEGFDLALLSGFYAFPRFLEAYGEKTGDNKYELPPSWQTALSAGAMIGQIAGLSIAGLVAQRIGYKRTMIGALALMIAFISIPFFAGSLRELFVGEVMQGIPWGVFETMPAAYASEISPLVLRPYITTWANACWVLGQLVAAGVLRGFLNVESEWAYRAPFALQWVWPVPILAAVFFAPESPWWLERNGRSDEARLSLEKLTDYDAETLHHTVELIKYTLVVETRRDTGQEDHHTIWSRSKNTLSIYAQCSRGADRRRTEISCLTWISQSLCGSSLMAFAPYFFTIAGLSTRRAYTLQLAGMALGAVGVVGAWFLMSYAGRRTLYVGGLFTLFVLLLTIGLLGAFALQREGAAWTIAILLLLYIIAYDLTVGPCCYCIVTEIPSTRLRAATVALARICYNICGIFSVAMNPRMLNPLGWNWGPKAALLWAGLCFLCWMWAFWRLPEPKGRNYGELDILFQQKIKAKDFRKHRIDQSRTMNSTQPKLRREDSGVVSMSSGETLHDKPAILV